MIVTALTGNFGMGKSAVASLFGSLGAVTIDSDLVVAGLLCRKTVISRIARLLGPETVNPDGSLDRKCIAEKIFADADKRKKLEAILHPLVLKNIESEIRSMADRNSLVIVEVPLLFEGGFQKRFDSTITVFTSKKTALSRLKGKGIPRKEALKRLNAQMNIRLKKRLADYCINNNGSKRDTAAQVRSIFRSLTEKAGHSPNRGRRRI